MTGYKDCEPAVHVECPKLYKLKAVKNLIGNIETYIKKKTCTKSEQGIHKEM